MSIILVYGGAIDGSMKSIISGVDPSIGSLYDRLQELPNLINIFNVLRFRCLCSPRCGHNNWKWKCDQY